jgi:LmbE family N-acetylglucosaminyl deacetylase
VIRPVRPPLERRNHRSGITLVRGQKLVVVSPHLDDAVFSLGATLADASRAGIEIVNLTVFAADPDSTELPSKWDRKAGFSSAGAAARGRRAEDAKACAVIGMKPVWLQYPDSHYRSDRSNVWNEMAAVLEGADLVLIPGFPLLHPDHRLVRSLVLERMNELPDIALYVEQPYAEMEWFSERRLPGEPHAADSAEPPTRWVRVRPSPQAWVRKQRALAAYGSQLRAFTRPAGRMLARIALYELGRGGEGLGFSVGTHPTTTTPAVEASGTPA